jgi:hypothetical protein
MVSFNTSPGKESVIKIVSEVGVLVYSQALATPTQKSVVLKISSAWDKGIYYITLHNKEEITARGTLLID